MEYLHKGDLYGSFKPLNVQEQVSVRHSAEHTYVGIQTVAEYADDTQHNADEKSDVDGHNYDGQERGEPYEAILPALLLESWKLGDLHQHALQGDHHNGC